MYSSIKILSEMFAWFHEKCIEIRVLLKTAAQNDNCFSQYILRDNIN